MRLWTLHPRYLDTRGLVALWREALLARAVLRGGTRGYRAHPQLLRFRAHPTPLRAINAYLSLVHAEALRREYRFDRSKIGPVVPGLAVPATNGQLVYERQHLLAKLRARDRAAYRALLGVTAPEPHPLFLLGAGPVADWERPAR